MRCIPSQPALCLGRLNAPGRTAEGAVAEGLGVAQYLQLFDLLQQVLQGHVLVTGVLLPDGVLQALQVGFS